MFVMKKASSGNFIYFLFFLFLFLKAYIQYMKFARRAEGIKESRAVFKRAREDSRTNFHVSFKITSRCRFHFLSKFADVYLKKIEFYVSMGSYLERIF